MYKMNQCTLVAAVVVTAAAAALRSRTQERERALAQHNFAYSLAAFMYLVVGQLAFFKRILLQPPPLR